MQEFDDIYDKKLAKKYAKYEIQRLSERIDRKRDIGAGRPFKMDLRDRFLMLLVYYRLYITYTLSGFLFDLDQSTVCRDIQKIEKLIRECVPIPQKIYGITKRLKTTEEVEQYFPALSCFYRFHRTADSKTCRQKKKKGVLFRQRRKDILL